MRVKVGDTVDVWKTVWMPDVNSSGVHEKCLTGELLRVQMIDQTKLPESLAVFTSWSYQETAEAIKEMVVRGAGAIGAAAGFAMAQAAQCPETDPVRYFESLEGAARYIKGTRPTAHDLFYAVDSVLAEMRQHESPSAAREAAVRKAQELARANEQACYEIGHHGFSLLQAHTNILTHCNAGWLAFVDWGSATAPLYLGRRYGKDFFVWVDVTDPKMQGAKLTSWELNHEGIENKIIADNAGGLYMQRGLVDAVIVGCDRVARNGDVANKVGTYLKALAAREHGIPFYVAAPTSTIDVRCESGACIPIEERSQDEVLYKSGYCERTQRTETVRVAPKESKAANPAFDVTPAHLVTALITEKGIISPVREETMETFVRTYLSERH